MEMNFFYSNRYVIRNLSYKEHSKLLVEIGTREVAIYMKDFSFFAIFSNTDLKIFFNCCTYQVAVLKIKEPTLEIPRISIKFIIITYIFSKNSKKKFAMMISNKG